MSTILTPPEDRLPVLTYVGPHDDKQIAAALRRELLRDGQAFYVHNRVSSIEQAAARVRELVPEARVVVAHGQMNEDVLERTVQGFWNREYDILVCTTVVEAGLDISNANTLIVERADTFGLSQLHQLRGRVGRSRERGYAYFLYPPHAPLTETAYDRLATIAQNNELGAGMAVAMKDLEIRGAGNVLGWNSPATSPAWDSTCTCGWWARRSRPIGRPPTAKPSRPPRSPRTCASTCRWTRTCQRTTSPATGYAWRPIGGLPPRRPTTRSPPLSRNSPTATAPSRNRLSGWWPSPGCVCCAVDTASPKCPRRRRRRCGYRP
ncbi:helicase conserved C-terminal domain protein [Mycobacterium xenopi 4042]|uniref:Helicase conserved C-terminal domain protein n=1 Tax=Mycobacterium xenopi 4042 TaxID=1299334 RepID=X8AGG2_MYCXE|nr:helicase conserved C-terminal domain protein [Mycobacterium xenopi 4042]